MTKTKLLKQVISDWRELRRNLEYYNEYGNLILLGEMEFRRNKDEDFIAQALDKAYSAGDKNEEYDFEPGQWYRVSKSVCVKNGKKYIENSRIEKINPLDQE